MLSKEINFSETVSVIKPTFGLRQFEIERNEPKLILLILCSVLIPWKRMGENGCHNSMLSLLLFIIPCYY